MSWPPSGNIEILAPAAITAPAWQHDFEKKEAFAKLLKEGLKPFEAAIKIFMNDNGAALWVSQNWPQDELVKAVVDKPEKSLKILDKEEVAAKVLAFAEEKDNSGRFYVNESQERLKALELYAKICGYINNGSIVIPPVINDNRRMEIVLVSPDRKEEQKQFKQIEETKIETLDLPVKLVKSS
jgi:hypothetical protein